MRPFLDDLGRRLHAVGPAARRAPVTTYAHVRSEWAKTVRWFHDRPHIRCRILDAAVFTLLGFLVVVPWINGGWLNLLDWVSGPSKSVTDAAYGLDDRQSDAMPIRIALALLRDVVGSRIAGWLPILLVFPLAATGIGALVGGSIQRRWTASIAYLCNAFVVDRIYAGHILLMLGMAMLPWVVASFLAARREGRIFRVRSALWFSLLVGTSPHMAWIGAVAVLAVHLVPRPRRVDVIRIALTAAAVAATTIYSLTIFLAGSRTSDVGLADLDAFATAGTNPVERLLNVVTLRGFWRAGPELDPVAGVAGTVVLAVLVGVAIVGVRSTWHASRHSPTIRVVTLAGAVGALLATGAHGPIGPVYSALYRIVPLFEVMREAQKFAMLTALALAVGFGFGTEELVARYGRSHRRVRPVIRRTAVLAGCAVLPILTAPPLLLGLGGQIETEDYPSSWQLAAEVLDEHPESPGSVLVLPWHQYQPYGFTQSRAVNTPAAAFFEREVIIRDDPELADLAGSTTQRSTFLDVVLARSGTLRRLGRLLSPLGIDFVLVTTTSTDPSLPTWLDEQTDLEQVLATDDLALYRNLVPAPGRVDQVRRVSSISEHIELVERGIVGAEAVVVDPTVASERDPIATETTPGAVSWASPVRFDIAAGAEPWAVVPTPTASGWKVDGRGGITTVEGSTLFAVGPDGTGVSYEPWFAVRRGYAASAGALALLVLAGLIEHRRQIAGHPLLHRAVAAVRRSWDTCWHGVGRAYVAAWMVAAIAVTSWFRAGTFVATGDMGPFIRRGWAPEAWWSWNHAITGAGSAAYVMARWYELFLIDALAFVGGSETLAQRLFYMTIYPMVAVGVAYVAGAFTRNRLAIAAAGSFAVLNGFFLTRLPNPLNIISVGSIALMTGLGLRVAQGAVKPKWLLGVALLPMSFLSYNPPMLTVALAWTSVGVAGVAALVWGWRAGWRIIRYGIAAAPWALALNIFWIVPFAHAFTGGGGATATANTDPTAWAWSQAQNNIPNVLTMSANWAWYKPQYLPFTPMLDQPGAITLRYALPMLVIAAPVLARPTRRRAALVLLSLVAVFTILAKGLQPPLSGFNMLLYQRMPGFWLFREPMSKLGQLLITFEGALIALVIEGVLARVRPLTFRARWLGRAVLTASVVAVLAWPHPLITGTVIPDERPLQPPAHVAVPGYWRATASLIDSDPAPGKVLVLPLDDYYQMPTTWGFSGVDSIANLLLRHPVVQRKPDGYFGDTAGFAAQVNLVEQALAAGDLPAVRPLLENLGVNWVIVRHDLVLGDPLRTFIEPGPLGEALARVDGVEQIQDGTLDVYRLNRDGVPTVTSGPEPLLVPGGPTATAAIIASLPVGSTVVGDPEDQSAIPDDPVPGPDAQFARDAVYWPVPAVAGGAPSTEFVVDEAGTFSVDQRARGEVTVVPVETSTGGGQAILELTDPTSVVIDGKTVSRRKPVQLPLEQPGVVAVGTPLRTVSLDGWRSPAMPVTTRAADGVPTITIGAGTDVTAWRLADLGRQVPDFGGVYDCNDYEPRPSSELALRAAWLDDDGSPFVRLSARDHAACIAAPVVDALAGDTVRLRLEHRTVTGKRPATCLLETKADGSSECVLSYRLSTSTDWDRFELVHTVSEDVVGVQVVLYANVGLRNSPPTVSDYRNVTVDLLEPVLDATVWPEPVETTTVRLEEGTHTMELRGGATGSLLAEFEPLEDCFRYDDLSFEEAGLEASVFEAEGSLVYELRAKHHMACIGATLPDFGGDGLYTLSYDHRSVAVRKPKICFYLRGPNVCEPLPANGAEQEWTTYSRSMRLRLELAETRLYLYGPRDLQGEQSSIVQYRNVHVTPNASSTAIVLTRVPAPGATGSASSVDWSRSSPAEYRADLTNAEAGSVVTLRETSAPGWRAGSTNVDLETVRLNGYQNGWRMVGDAQGATRIDIEYGPAFTARRALMVSIVAGALIPGLRIASSLRRRWTLRFCDERPDASEEDQ